MLKAPKEDLRVCLYGPFQYGIYVNLHYFWILDLYL